MEWYNTLSELRHRYAIPIALRNSDSLLCHSMFDCLSPYRHFLHVSPSFVYPSGNLMYTSTSVRSAMRKAVSMSTIWTVQA
eukprot:Awhi_evm2s465